ncbi:tripartite tricarboxylate transporter TctB family protein [Streptomyces sp. WMMC500]|nr:tripartite tricarboxylate transporter TctB family protein [Streptomyces sp. WMMC500]WBB60724.1 tripartite tricarboxylate transporter TctB family protein [Streptomyces sp. WMMC500]
MTNEPTTDGTRMPGGPPDDRDAPDGAAGGPLAALRGRSELGVCVLLLALGVVVLTDALTMDTDYAQRGPVGPEAVPTVVGTALLVVAALLAVDVLRGGKGEAEGGEDVDLDAPSEWRTVLLLAGVFLATAFLIGEVGFPVAGALLFWGAAYALGSRAFGTDPLVAAVLSVTTYLVFNNLLGVPLPGGPLMEVL